MKKENLLVVFLTALALLVVIGLIGWQAPQLLGLPGNPQASPTDAQTAPFFDGVFRRQDLSSKTFSLPDPRTGTRGKPFFPDLGGIGPHDVLGFRNRCVPHITDVVAIGDSHTYGNNVTVEQNWPSQVQESLSDLTGKVYAMAADGWGSVQYLEMFSNATVFSPKTVIVAFHSGDDALDSFHMAYGDPYWRELVPDTMLSAADAPQVKDPPPVSEQWQATFRDGSKVTFAPTLRLASNQDHPAVRAGYSIMADVASRIVDLARPLKVQVIFTILPSKELVYARKVREERLTPPPDYQTLVERETQNIARLAERISALPGAVYVDVVRPLQQGAMEKGSFFPADIDDHALEAAHHIIGVALANSVREHLVSRPKGIYAVAVGTDKFQYVLINDEGAWIFDSPDWIEANGWPPGDISILPGRDFLAVPRRGVIKEVDKERFGPPRSVAD